MPVAKVVSGYFQRMHFSSLRRDGFAKGKRFKSMVENRARNQNIQTKRKKRENIDHQNHN